MRVSIPRTRDKDNFVIYVTDVSILKPRVTWFVYHKDQIGAWDINLISHRI